MQLMQPKVITQGVPPGSIVLRNAWFDKFSILQQHWQH
jgi:hypothetical protein